MNHNLTLYFTMRFIDGLRDDLHAAVLIQRPSCLDTAVVLAKLQDEVASVRCKEFRHSDYSFQQKPTSGSPLPLPAPPLKPSSSQSDDRRGTDAARARSTDERWRALRAQHHAQGLCQFCVQRSGSRGIPVLTEFNSMQCKK